LSTHFFCIVFHNLCSLSDISFITLSGSTINNYKLLPVNSIYAYIFNRTAYINFTGGNKIYDNTLQKECINILNGNRESIYINCIETSTNIKIEPKILDKIKKQKDYYFLIDNREFLGVYITESKTYIIASAIDFDGLNKLRKLKFILFAVFIASITITTSLSYFFVSSALKPLSKLNDQIQQTTELNLSQKVEEGNGKDEIAQIAKNVNEMLERLNKAFQLQKNFVHHASHELRTPLTTMYASTEAALNKKLSETDYKKVLTSLKEDQNSLIELTNSLLLLYQFDKLKFFYATTGSITKL
jgi:signal transduction histidine kinase